MCQRYKLNTDLGNPVQGPDHKTILLRNLKTAIRLHSWILSGNKMKSKYFVTLGINLLLHSLSKACAIESWIGLFITPWVGCCPVSQNVLISGYNHKICWKFPLAKIISFSFSWTICQGQGVTCGGGYDACTVIVQYVQIIWAWFLHLVPKFQGFQEWGSSCPLIWTAAQVVKCHVLPTRSLDSTFLLSAMELPITVLRKP